MAVHYNVVYVSKGKDGREFTSRVGVIMDTKNGLALKLEMIPTNFSGWLNLEAPRAAGSREPIKTSTQMQPNNDDPNDQIPF